MRRFSAEAGVQDPSARLSVQGVFKDSTEDLCKRSQSKSSHGKIYVRDLLARSLLRNLYAMSLYKIYIRGVVARSLYKEVSWQDLFMGSL